MTLTTMLKRVVPVGVKRAWRTWRDAPPPEVAGLFVKSALKWYLDRLACDETGVEADGWVVFPTKDRDALTITCNGAPFESIDWHPRPDLLSFYPFLKRTHDWTPIGFRARLGPNARRPAIGDWVAVQIADKATGAPRNDLGPAVSIRVPAPNEVWPDAARRQRVSGDTDFDAFRRTGATAFQRLRDGLRATIGRDFGDFPRVLDWGCGCGRTTRYFAEFPTCRVTGVDVDPDNAGWCAANMPFGEYLPIPLHPPTRLADASFDLALGLSVFTHLKEPDQFEWLAELRRIVRPGGILLMTTHGEASIVASKLPRVPFQKLMRDGIVDVPNGQYDADLPETEYYRNTVHTEEYLRREWGKYFDLRAYLPGWLGIQDLVVMERRAG